MAVIVSGTVTVTGTCPGCQGTCTAQTNAVGRPGGTTTVRSQGNCAHCGHLMTLTATVEWPTTITIPTTDPT